MPNLTPDEPTTGPAGHEPGFAVDPQAQRQTVLIVARSPVNLVVLSRIAERARMRPVTEAPERAAPLVEKLRPTIIILDGGPDLHECDALLAPISVSKRFDDRKPYAILLTPNNRPPADILDAGIIDAVVAKPVTPDRLQPLLERVRDLRDGR